MTEILSTADQTVQPSLPLEQRLRFRSDSLRIKHEAVNLSEREALLDPDEVEDQFGLALGSLQAIVALPDKPNFIEDYQKIQPIYCFLLNESSNAQGQHADESKKTYILATANQLSQLAAAYQNQDIDPIDPQGVINGMVVLTAGESQAIGRGKNNADSSSRHWLPGVAFDVNLAANEGIKYQAVSHDHGEFWVDEATDLHYRDDSYNHTDIIRSNS